VQRIADYLVAFALVMQVDAGFDHAAK
jgi:hypothetical protein